MYAIRSYYATTVIGVMPEGFIQPVPTDIWQPFDLPEAQRTAIAELGARGAGESNGRSSRNNFV